MGTLEFENKKYTFTWGRIILLFAGAPLFALVMYYSHQWIWLHEITSKITIIFLNLIYPGDFGSVYLPDNQITFSDFLKGIFTKEYLHPVWAISVRMADGTQRGDIGFETLCTGVHAIAIFMAAILFTPHPIEEDTTKGIWLRKMKGILVTSFVFYIVNIIRMIIQLGLYRNGAVWEDVHYPISAASSFIAVACVLLMHKFVPEFIMSLIWIGDELREKFGKTPSDGNQDQNSSTSDELDNNQLELDNQSKSDEHSELNEGPKVEISEQVVANREEE